MNEKSREIEVALSILESLLKDLQGNAKIELQLKTMKLIDVLNLKADGKLKDGFKFVFDDNVYRLKNDGKFKDNNGNSISRTYIVENCLNEHVIILEEGKDD